MIKHIVMWKFKDGEEENKNDPRHVKVSNLCKSIRTDRACIDIEE